MRVHADLVKRFINKDTPSIRSLARQKPQSREYIRRRITRSLETLLSKTKFSDKTLGTKGPLIMIADAMWYWIRKKKWTLYVILLKPIHGNSAVIMPVAVLPGHECADGWKTALDRLGKKRLNRVVALVSDGVSGLATYAKEHGWLTQRCHFHLLSSLQNYASTGSRSKNRPFAVYLTDTVRELVTTKDEQRVAALQQELQVLLGNLRSRGLKRVLNGLLMDLSHFRTYLDHPELNLPTTSNAAESAIQMIRDLLYRARGFSSVRSLKNWIRALILVRSTIVCNGHKSTK